MIYKSIVRLTSIVVLLAGTVTTTLGQPPRGPLVISPQVNADKTVTFRYLAPLAKDVKLSAQFEKGPRPMTRDTVGIWSITVGPVSPDIYPYSFQVDGVTVMDPANTSRFSRTIKPAW